MFGKKKAAMLVGELLGTGILTLVVLSIRNSQVGIPFFVALGAGLAIATVTLTLHTISGAHVNPALTLGLWTARKIKTIPALTYIAVQLLGAFGAYWLYTYLINKNDFPSATGEFDVRIMLAEALGTFVFVWAWVAAAARRIEGWQFAATVGSAFAVGIMIASIAAGGVINPAVALGVSSWDWGTYVLGPVLGALVAANVHYFLFADRDVDEARVTGPAKSTVASRTAASTVTNKTTAKSATKKTAKKTRSKK